MNGTDRSKTLSGIGDFRLAIACPMANERETAVKFVTEMLAQASVFKEVVFIAVLDKASTDGTIDLLQAFAAEEPRLKVVWAPENRGVVDAYLRCYREALATGFEWILEVDAGYSHQATDLPKFFGAMLAGHDCVFGTRFAPGGRMIGAGLHRLVLSRGGGILTNMLLGTRISDMTSGYQMFRRRALQEILQRGIRSRGHFFQTEMKVYCRNMRIAEVPIHYRASATSMTGGTIVDALGQLAILFRQRLAGTL